MALTFPASPVNGQIYEQYIYDATTQSWRVYGTDTGITNLLPQKANLNGGNTFSGTQTLNTPLAVTSGGTGTNTLASGAYLKGAGASAVTAQTGIPTGDITSGILGVARGGTGFATGSGLTPIIPTSVSVGSGTASVSSSGIITITGATTVSVNGCFNSNHTNYRILFNNTAASVAADGNFRLRASGVDSPDSYRRNGVLVDGTGVVGYGNVDSGATWGNALYFHPAASNGHAHAALEIREPAVVRPTTYSTILQGWTGSTNRFIIATGFHNTVASYDGFTIIASSGNFSGTFRIYGYN